VLRSVLPTRASAARERHAQLVDENRRLRRTLEQWLVSRARPD
jgi:hypothetical protein